MVRIGPTQNTAANKGRAALILAEEHVNQLAVFNVGGGGVLAVAVSHLSGLSLICWTNYNKLLEDIQLILQTILNN
jgi:hypothetical protein